MSDADFIVIGSGPAGVSAALPLAQAGHRVLLLDGADSYELAPASNTERMLGGMLEGLSAEDGLSPKFRTPLARRILSRFAEANGISSENFVGVGALARGGLSRVWGAFVTEFADRDFAGWPIGLQDLAPSYARVCERIGVNGTGGDTVGGELGQSGPLQPPLPLGAAATLLLGRYRPDGKGLKLGLARNAVLSAAHDGRSACDLRNACLWGCPIGAIYDARQDLARLQAHANFRLVDGATVVSLRKTADGWQALAADGRHFSAPRLLLAAGTLGSSRLVAPLLPCQEEWLLLSNPVMAMPLLIPSVLTAALKPSHSLAQLAFFLTSENQPEVSGAVYEVTGLPPSSFVNRLPLGRRAGAALFGLLAPALVVAVSYFPGSLSRNRMRVGIAGSLHVIGGVDPALARIAAETARHLRQSWRALGAFALPGTQLALPGTDAHLAGTLPMGGKMATGTTALGELQGQPGLHIVDGAILPSLPTRHVTLTIMANADRIGTQLARVGPAD